MMHLLTGSGDCVGRIRMRTVTHEFILTVRIIYNHILSQQHDNVMNLIK